MFTRKEHLTYCKVCENRTFSGKEGIICKITNAQANFESTCDDYSGDEKTINNFNQRHNFNNRINDITFGLDNIGIRSGFKVGLLLIGGSVIFFMLFIFTDGFLIYSIIMFLMALTSIISAMVN